MKRCIPVILIGLIVLSSLQAQQVRYTGISFSGDGNIYATTDSEGTVRFYHWGTGIIDYQRRITSGAITELSLNFDGSRALLNDGEVLVLFTPPPEPDLSAEWSILGEEITQARFNGHSGYIYIKEGRVFSEGIEQWEYSIPGSLPIATATLKKDFPRDVFVAFTNGEVHELSPDGELINKFSTDFDSAITFLEVHNDDLVVATDRRVSKFHVGQLVWEAKVASKIVDIAAGAESNYLTVALNDGTIRKYHLERGISMSDFFLPRTTYIDVSPLGDTVAVQTNGSIHQWENTRAK